MMWDILAKVGAYLLGYNCSPSYEYTNETFLLTTHKEYMISTNVVNSINT